MKVAIMQPYFFPYLGYFSLIKNTNKFILLDTVQFIRHGWIERNRILKPNEGWQYINVPLVKHSQNTLIKDIKISSNEDWRSKIIRQLEHYKKISPYFNDVMNFIHNALKIETDSITVLNAHLLGKICSYIGFNPDIEIFSELNIEIEKPKAPDEWALNICKKLDNVIEYWNPPGGVNFFYIDKYRKKGIELKFIKAILEEYSQGRKEFEPGLSIIDVMMFNSRDDIKRMLANYEFI